MTLFNNILSSVSVRVIIFVQKLSPFILLFQAIVSIEVHIYSVLIHYVIMQKL